MTKPPLLVGYTTLALLGSAIVWRRSRDGGSSLPLGRPGFLIEEEAPQERYYLPFHQVDTLCSWDRSSLDGYYDTGIASPVKPTDLSDRLLRPEQWCRDHLAIPPGIPTRDDKEDEADQEERRLGTTNSFSPNKGEVRALVLLLAFPEHIANRTLPTRDYFDRLCNTNISDYFFRQSFGQYRVSCDVMEWATLPYGQELYANALSNLVGHEYASDFFVPEVLDDAKFDLSRYDANDDRAMDVVIALHSGYAAEYRRGQECGDTEPRHRFHSQGHVDSPLDTYVRNGTRLAGYAISSVFDFVCNDDPAGIGVIAHEWLHVLRGLPDLYDPSTGRVGGLAAFDIMAAVKGPVWGKGPSSMTSYSRIRAGWMEATEIMYNGQYTVLPLSRHPQAYTIKQGFAEQEYLLIENRPAVDDDVNLFGGGLLVLHVDDAKRGQGTVKDWQAVDKDHYKVAIVQADGRYDIERGRNNGDADDFWKAGSVIESPITDSYYNGPTGITIEIVSSYQADDDDTIVIQVFGLIDPPKVPRISPTSAPVEIVTPTARPMKQPIASSLTTSAGTSMKPSAGSSSFPTMVSTNPSLSGTDRPTTPFNNNSNTSTVATSHQKQSSAPSAEVTAPTTQSPQPKTGLVVVESASSPSPIQRNTFSPAAMVSPVSSFTSSSSDRRWAVHGVSLIMGMVSVTIMVHLT